MVTELGETELEPQPYVADRPPLETARLHVTDVRAWAGETVPAFRVSPETLDPEVQDTIVAGRSVCTASAK